MPACKARSTVPSGHILESAQLGAGANMHDRSQGRQHIGSSANPDRGLTFRSGKLHRSCGCSSVTHCCCRSQSVSPMDRSHACSAASCTAALRAPDGRAPLSATVLLDGAEPAASPAAVAAAAVGTPWPSCVRRVVAADSTAGSQPAGSRPRTSTKALKYAT